MKATNVDRHLKEKLRDPYFRELYELEEQKLEVVKRIIQHRIQQELSQRQLAEKVGVSQQQISKIENGEFSSLTTLEKVLLAIGHTVRLEVARLSPKKASRIEQAMLAYQEA